MLGKEEDGKRVGWGDGKMKKMKKTRKETYELPDEAKLLNRKMRTRIRVRDLCRVGDEVRNKLEMCGRGSVRRKKKKKSEASEEIFNLCEKLEDEKFPRLPGDL